MTLVNPTTQVSCKNLMIKIIKSLSNAPGQECKKVYFERSDKNGPQPGLRANIFDALCKIKE